MVVASAVIATSFFFTTKRTENTEIFMGESKKDSVPFVFSVVN
jgi:hypothetical protein